MNASAAVSAQSQAGTLYGPNHPKKAAARRQRSPWEVCPTSTVLVPFAVTSVGEARRALRADLLARGADRSLVDDAVLVLSEVLANAVLHARPIKDGHLRVCWSLLDGDVRIEVTDGGATTRPSAGMPGMSATGGRGLAIVNEIAGDWGVREQFRETTVWAALPAARQGASREALLPTG